MIVTIDKTVFEGLGGTSAKDFVQVRFTGIQQLPPEINSIVDYDNDQIPDFSVR